MRILVINYEFPPLGGGGGVACRKVVMGWLSLGHKIDVVTSRFGRLKRVEKINNLSIYRVHALGRKELSVASMLSMISFVFFGFLKASSLCKEEKYDFIYTYFVVPTGPVGYIVSRINRLPNLLNIVGGDIYDPTKKNSPHRHWVFRKIVSFLINNASSVVAISSDTKKNAIKYYNIKNNIKVIPIPYDVVNFQGVDRTAFGLDRDKKYLITVGRLVKRKGLEYFIEALSLLPNNIEGLIIGDGPEKNSLLEQTKKLKLEKRVHFLGFISEERKFQYLSNADIYILSSLHEGFGIVLQEAMQVGLPIVATNNGGQTDLIENGKNGFLVEPQNPEEIVERVSKLLNNPKLSSSIRNNNCEKIRNFSLNNIAEQYIQLVN